jgi:hypothetical protein
MPVIEGAMAFALVGAGFAYLFGKGETITDHVSFQNEMISKSVFNAIQKCNTEFDITQFIGVDCKAGSATKPFAGNQGCLKCLDVQNKFRLSRNQYQIDAVASVPGYIPQTFEELPQDVIDGYGVDKVCQFQCTNCIFDRVTQTSSTAVNVKCSFSVQFLEDLKSEVKASVSESINNKQDVLGQLGSMFSSNTDSLSTNYASYVSSKFDVEMQSLVLTDIESIQSITIGGATDTNDSYYVNNLQQSIHIKGIVSSVSNANFVNKITSTNDFNASLKQFNKNDTTGDIAKDLANTITGLAKLWGSIVGKVIMLVVTLLVGILVVVGALMAFKPKIAQQLLSAAVAKATG